ncbi:AAA family ATPase [Kutzneria sp. NPDC051319]|uniref:AAA family ATPase n=1 Tax=Kutzneria sp. NPDC051319 TaxID=3155047 RepID=UPI0034389A7D
MRLTYAQARNFRALQDVRVDIDAIATLVVGRNNSGKTSLVDLFCKFFDQDGCAFTLEDISTAKIKCIAQAIERYRHAEASQLAGDIEVAERLYQEAFATLPVISLTIGIEYEDSDDLTALSEVILDLDETRHDATVVAQVEVASPADFLATFATADEDAAVIEKRLRKREEFRRVFAVRFYAVDAQQDSNRNPIDRSKVERIFATDFIYAQHRLDDTTTDQTKTLSKAFARFYDLNGDGDPTVREIDEDLAGVAAKLDVDYETLFKPIFADLKDFGYDTATQLQHLKIIASLETSHVLKGNTRLYYESETDGQLLPEAHNGLGYTKLIHTILQFVTFHQNFVKATPRPAFQVLFIEEPEAHLHPQMQEVFIKNIQQFIKGKTDWPVQVVITTHSSHIVASGRFDSIRYFDKTADSVDVRDLATFRSTVKADVDATMDFLTQHLELHRCDMFFADKVVLIEGTVERLMLPAMIKQCASGLEHEYVSVVEVGGAYALNFKELLAFIRVPTLIVTDLDSVDPALNRTKCRPDTKDAVTSNTTLANWLPGVKPIATLRGLSDTAKTEKGLIRVAYQVPEAGGRSGRSFEEAFILRNAAVLRSHADALSVRKLFVGPNGSLYTAEQIVSKSYEIADGIDKKTDFAFDLLRMVGWETPRYIEEGLKWLATHS